LSAQKQNNGYPEKEDLLLLKIILSTATRLASREWALVISLSSMNAHMTSQMTTGGEWALASGANVLFLYFFSILNVRSRLDGRRSDSGWLSGVWGERRKRMGEHVGHDLRLL